MDVLSPGGLIVRAVAMQAAHRTRYPDVRPGHLLIALLDLAAGDEATLAEVARALSYTPKRHRRARWGQKVVAQALDGLTGSLSGATKAVESQLGEGPDKARETQIYRRDNASREIYRVADRLARASGSLYVEAIHLLWAFTVSETNPDVALLKGAGIDPVALAERCERGAAEVYSDAVAPETEAAPKALPTTPFLDKYGKDLTALARRDDNSPGATPIIGLDRVVLTICQGLLRQDKGAVLLLGEAGVGKTAAVEALAQAIAGGNLPGVLRSRFAGVRVIEVAMGALVAGTSYRGQFEERVQKLLDEARQNLDTLVVFIDEIHMVMGVGSGNQGTMDAANLLKPALSRGEIRLIGATTPAEFGQTIERDRAMARRFERIFLEEPDAAATRRILGGVRDRLATHYRLAIRDDALDAAVHLSRRYIQDQCQPAKALDVLHEACAHMVCAHPAQENWQDPTRSCPVPIRLELDPTAVATVVAKRCRIPVERVLAQNTDQVARVRAALEREIVGQDNAKSAVVDVIARASLGFTDESRPDGVFLFLGPTGTGKTELARTVARAMFGDRDEHFVVVDMSDYSEAFQASRLAGAPPGYVGHERGGVLTEAVRRQPYCVVLFDEIEKAHPDALKVFLQIFDRGQLQDGHGRTVDFTKTLIFLTSNIGTSEEGPRFGVAVADPAAQNRARRDRLEQAVRRHLPPELLNRIDATVVFDALGHETVRRVAEKFVGQWQSRLAERSVAFALSDAAWELLATLGHSPQFGARAMRRVVEQQVVQAIASHLHAAGAASATALLVDARDGQFVVNPRP